MIRQYYGRSIVALLLIPVVTVSAAAIDYLIDPELARGHPNYIRNFALLQHLRFGVVIVALMLVIALWLLACLWLLRARSQQWHRAPRGRPARYPAGGGACRARCLRRHVGVRRHGPGGLCIRAALCAVAGWL